MRTRVKRRGGKTWITEVPDVRMDNVVRLRGMEILLTHRGEEVSLQDLLVYSGEAFHLCHGTTWERRTGLCISTEPCLNLATAYGYEAHWTRPRWFADLSRLGRDERWALSQNFLGQIWSHVDAGWPVLFGGAHGQCAEWRVVVGEERLVFGCGQLPGCCHRVPADAGVGARRRDRNPARPPGDQLSAPSRPEETNPALT